MQKSYISDDLNTLVRRMQSSSPTVEKKKKRERENEQEKKPVLSKQSLQHMTVF